MDPIVLEARDKFAKCVASFEGSLSKLRSGRANPGMLAGITCDYYGERMDINNLSSVTVPEPRQIVVKPYSREDIKPIASAIAGANLGINPQVEADCIRLIIPPLTEDTRRQIAKDAKAMGEDAKVSIRNVRRDFLDLVKIDEEMSDDYKDRVKEDIQKEVDNAMKQVEEILAAKTKEILSI